MIRYNDNDYVINGLHKQKGMKYGYAAEKLGITRDAYCRKRQGYRSFTFLEIEKLQTLLEIAPEDMMRLERVEK